MKRYSISVDETTYKLIEEKAKESLKTSYFSPLYQIT